MGIFKIADGHRRIVIIENSTVKIYSEEVIRGFNESILGLGQLNNEAKQVNALVAIFDLEGFTNFCKQIDPHLAVPHYLNDFLQWFFFTLKVELMKSEENGECTLWADLPFFAKFLGDGLMLIWNTENLEQGEIRNIIVALYELCLKYKDDFYNSISNRFISPPLKLRCGIARGIIYSVGDGDDFVGPCINMAARLQKLGPFTFCFSRRGIDKLKFAYPYKDLFTVLKVKVRGVGEEELVCVLVGEYEVLSDDLRKDFRKS